MPFINQHLNEDFIKKKKKLFKQEAEKMRPSISINVWERFNKNSIDKCPITVVQSAKVNRCNFLI